MHFQCKKQDLLAGVNLVEKAVSNQDTLPVLTGIHLIAEKNNLTLTSTNLELTIRTKVTVHTTTPGSTVINGKLFSSIIRKLPDEPVIVEQKEKHLLITAGTIEFNLNYLTTEEFPAFPRIENKILSMSARQLAKMIKNTVFATCTDETRPFLSGCLFEISSEKFNMVATDSNRLAFIQSSLTHPIENDYRMIIPAKALTEVLKSMPQDESLIDLYSLQEQLAFKFEDTVIITRLIDSQFPNYRAVIPGEQPIKVTIKRASLQQAVERAALFDKDGTRPVVFEVTDGVLEVKTPASEIGQLCEQINVEHTGENGKAAYSSRLVLEMLKASGDDLVALEYNADLRQALLKPAGSDQHLYVLMPMRY